MAGERFPRLFGSDIIDTGTMCTYRMPAPGSVGEHVSGLADLESALALLKSEALNFGYRAIRDSAVRFDYIAKTEALVRAMREEVRAGRLTPAEAADAATQVRDEIMQASRRESSDIGRALAEQAKGTGPKLPALQERYAQRLFKESFEALLPANKNRVWLEIVEASGRQRPSFNLKAPRVATLGRGLVVFSAAVAVYNVATAEEPGRQAVKEGATAGAGVLGGMGGGALAGLACGPGAPVCVAIGVFVGGALAAAGAEVAFDAPW